MRPVRKRQGAAIVEFAVTLPVLLLILFGTIEICACYSLQQTLKVAAYQGCRIGLSSESTQDLVEKQTKFILDARGIKNYVVSVSADPATLAPTDYLTVQVNAPTGSNLPIFGWVVGNRTMAASVSMMTER